MLKNKFLLSAGIFVFVFAFFSFVGVGKVHASTSCTAATGNWSDITKWGGSCGANRIPTSADDVIIPYGVTMTVNINNAAAATVTLADPGASSNSLVIASNGVLQVTGALTIAGSSGAGNSTVSVADTGTLLSVGSFSIVGGSSTGNSVVTTGLGSISTGAITFSGVASRAQLTVTGAGTLNLYGTMSSGGTLNINSTAGLFTTGTSAINGAYTFGQGTVSSGTLSIGATTVFAGNLTVNGTLTNNSTVTTTASLTGSGTFVNNTGATLYVGGASTVNALTATATGNTVVYNSTGIQTIVLTSPYYNLTLSGTGTKTVNSPTVNGTFKIMIGGRTYIVSSGSSITSANISSTAVGVLIPSGTFILTSPDGYPLASTDGAVVAPQTCTAAFFNNLVTITGTGSVFTITPDTTKTCFVNGGGGGQLNVNTTPTPVTNPNKISSFTPTTVLTPATTNPVVTTLPPVVVSPTPTPVAVTISGCAPGNAFNTMTGASCGGASVTPKVSTNYNFGTTLLKIGSMGDAVKALQQFLNTKLGISLVVDGKFGSETFSVVKQWQKANGLTADGLVGPKTKALMQ